ncbi:hypothetical protein AB1K91_17920 [Terribacillus sp. 179-K 1B1 HS]|uniref:hypothetical protein n=1 Tax=Terribacillus sp. 179-K 1B1 HS TaxID=3142388 RepID=UPI0039A19D89
MSEIYYGETARRKRIDELRKSAMKRGRCTNSCCNREVSVNVRNDFDGDALLERVSSYLAKESARVMRRL